MKYLSNILGDAVEAFSGLPGVGRKTAMRLVLHLAQQKAEKSKDLARALVVLADDLKTCTNCGAYSDAEVCSICLDSKRDHSTICVVESIRDLLAIEEIQMYKGIYLVLGGLISPIDGIGPENLNINVLFEKLHSNDIREVILAIRPTIEGDTTAYYIYKNLPTSDVKLTMLARGVSFGADLEYADDLTLSRSLLNRTAFQLQDNSNL